MSARPYLCTMETEGKPCRFRGETPGDVTAHQERRHEMTLIARRAGYPDEPTWRLDPTFAHAETIETIEEQRADGGG